MRITTLIVVSILLFFADMTIIPFFSIFGTYGSLLFTFCGLFVILGDYYDAVALAVLSGVLQDIFFPYAFGLNTLVNLFVYLGITRLGGSLKAGTRAMPVLIVAVGAAVKNLVIYGVMLIFGFQGNLFSIPIGAAYVLIFGMLIYKKVIKFKRIPFIKKEWKFQ